MEGGWKWKVDGSGSMEVAVDGPNIRWPRGVTTTITKTSVMGMRNGNSQDQTPPHSRAWIACARAART